MDSDNGEDGGHNIDLWLFVICEYDDGGSDCGDDDNDDWVVIHRNYDVSSNCKLACTDYSTEITVAKVVMPVDHRYQSGLYILSFIIKMKDNS